MEKGKFFTLPGLQLRPLGRPARSQSLYRLQLANKGQLTFTTHYNKSVSINRAFEAHRLICTGAGGGGQRLSSAFF
jgi:hypothetical protein